jgi:NRPS condensation-like uncharacterized protein
MPEVLYICEENGKSVMWVRFHHAHTDGTGIFSYLEDVFAYYENLINDSNIPVKEIKKEQLSKRATFGVNQLMYLSRTYLDLKRMIKFFKRSPSPLAARDYTTTSQSPNIRNLTAAIKHVSTRSEYQKLKNSGKALSASPNDILMANLFKTAKEWSPEKKKRIRVAMPIDMRLAEDQLASATNIVSMCFLDIPKKFHSFHELLRAVHEETRQTISDRMGITLNRVMATIGLTPLAMFLFTRSQSCRTTLILTNLGRPFKNSPLTSSEGILEPGGIKLTALDSIPPVRKNTNLALSVNYYGGSLSITYRYDPTSFDLKTTGEFANLYETNLKKVLAY